MTDIKFTQENKDKWLARLRDPNSKQCRGYGYLQEGQATYVLVRPDQAMCCLVHCEFALTGQSTINSYMEFAFALFGGSLRNKLIELNDYQILTLPQIADWIEKNIPAVEE